MATAYVYKITNPEGASYVGSTLNLERRMRDYRQLGKDSKKRQRKIKESIIKHSISNHKLEVVWIGDEAERFKYERHYGVLYNCIDDIIGLNSTLPSFGDLPYIMSKSKIELNRMGSSYVIKSQNARKKLSDSYKKHELCENAKKSLKKALARKILQFTHDGILIKEFESTIDAAAELNIGRTSIKNNLNGQSNSAGGYVWKFKDGKQGILSKKIVQKTLSGDVVCVFDSISEAARSLNVSHGSISAVVNKRGVSCVGYKWEYLNIKK